MTQIDATEYVSDGFPPDEGKRLAEALLRQNGLDWESVVIDLTKCPSGLLITAFANSFLQYIYERYPNVLPAARKVHWQLKFPFQEDIFKKCTENFSPQSSE